MPLGRCESLHHCCGQSLLLSDSSAQAHIDIQEDFQNCNSFFLFDDATIVLGVCEIAEQSAGECSNVTANFIHALLVFVLVLEFTADNSGKSHSCVSQ